MFFFWFLNLYFPFSIISIRSIKFVNGLHIGLFLLTFWWGWGMFNMNFFFFNIMWSERSWTLFRLVYMIISLCRFCYKKYALFSPKLSILKFTFRVMFWRTFLWCLYWFCFLYEYLYCGIFPVFVIHVNNKTSKYLVQFFVFRCPLSVGNWLSWGCDDVCNILQIKNGIKRYRIPYFTKIKHLMHFTESFVP